MSTEYVLVVEEEGEEPIEVPTEEDGTLLLSTLSSQFPGATGLQYRNPHTQKMRGIRFNEGLFHAPLDDDGWNNKVFYCVFPKQVQDDTMVKYICTDLIVLGLSRRMTEEILLEYFEVFGDVLFAQVKIDKRTGYCKGYGFIRFASYDSQLRVLGQRHMIDGQCMSNLIFFQSLLAGLVRNTKDEPYTILEEQCTENMTAAQFTGTYEGSVQHEFDFNYQTNMGSQRSTPLLGMFTGTRGSDQMYNSENYLKTLRRTASNENQNRGQIAGCSQEQHLGPTFMPRPLPSFNLTPTVLEPNIAQNLYGVPMHVSNVVPKTEFNNTQYGMNQPSTSNQYVGQMGGYGNNYATGGENVTANQYGFGTYCPVTASPVPHSTGGFYQNLGGGMHGSNVHHPGHNLSNMGGMHAQGRPFPPHISTGVVGYNQMYGTDHGNNSGWNVLPRGNEDMHNWQTLVQHPNCPVPTKIAGRPMFNFVTGLPIVTQRQPEHN